MKVVILAWGLWTRLSEETTIKPKPMVEIWWKPILWHIIKIYSHYGYTDFVICLWYKWYYIKEWFANYFLHNSDVTFDLKNNKMTVHNNNCEDWKVTLVDTWDETLTWWRIKRVIDWWYIDWDEFMMTYWDWVSDVNIKELVDFHKSHWKLASLTAVQPEWKFWKLWLDWNNIYEFAEKKDNEDSYINGWFMILNKKVVHYISGDKMPFEKDPLENIAIDWELMAYKHKWFWQAMDTLKNRHDLEEMWENWNTPWKKW
jgi:glucose-1-phosphate cytidylyltransferase